MTKPLTWTEPEQSGASLCSLAVLRTGPAGDRHEFTPATPSDVASALNAAGAEVVREVVSELCVRPYEERIRLLREAIDLAMGLTGSDACIDHLCLAIETDDALAATPPPDLPLAEGSRFTAGHYGTHGVVDSYCITHELDSSNGVPFLQSRDADELNEGPWLADVLALARREGLV